MLWSKIENCAYQSERNSCLYKLRNIPEEETVLDVGEIPNSNCTPQKKIFFLKTSKTGSTTISNIMARFAMKHGLSGTFTA